MQKRTIIIIILLFLVGATFYYWQYRIKSIREEVFGFSGVVYSVDAENNFLIVRPQEKEKEVKVTLSPDTRLMKLNFPINLKDILEEEEFTMEEAQATIGDFEVGDNIFVKTNKNIAGRTEFNDVIFIHIMP